MKHTLLITAILIALCITCVGTPVMIEPEGAQPNMGIVAFGMFADEVESPNAIDFRSNKLYPVGDVDLFYGPKGRKAPDDYYKPPAGLGKSTVRDGDRRVVKSTFYELPGTGIWVVGLDSTQRSSIRSVIFNWGNVQYSTSFPADESFAAFPITVKQGEIRFLGVRRVLPKKHLPGADVLKDQPDFNKDWFGGVGHDEAELTEFFLRKFAENQSDGYWKLKAREMLGVGVPGNP